MEVLEDVFVACDDWRCRWYEVERLRGGVQGIVRRVRPRSNRQEAFLKVIKRNDNRERRARFFREASAYDTFDIPGVPRLIESNAHLHRSNKKLYIATEFIEGPTLREWRHLKASIRVEDGIHIACGILETLKICHAAKITHRDIKPDNIKLRHGTVSNPVLLDFGLSYHDTEEEEFATETAQEVGNRFLRLPELSSGSIMKNDVRSDLSFVGGILFFVLTGKHPNVLLDGEARLPHQRARDIYAIRRVAGSRIQRLLAVFDRAFAPKLGERFSDADTMLSTLEDTLINDSTNQTDDDNMRAILSVIQTTVERSKVEINRRINHFLREIQQYLRELTDSFDGALMMSQSGFNVEGQLGRNNLYWTRAGEKERVFSLEYEIRQIGEELVLVFNGESVFRTTLDATDYGESLRNLVVSRTLTDLRRELAGP